MDDIFPIVSAGNPSSRMDLTSPALISGLRSQGWQYLGQSYGSAHLHENYGQIWLIYNIPELQWSAQAPADALNSWLAEYDVLNQHRTCQ